MNSIIDVIGALIAGTVVIITIILTIINVQKIKYNTETMLNLYSSGDIYVSSIDQGFLEKVGLNLYNDEAPITIANQNIFEFRAKETRTATSMDTYRIFTTTTNNNRSLIITENGTEVFATTPVFIGTGDIFTYYDGGNPPLPTFDTALIHSVKVDLTFLAPAWNENILKPNLEYPITFWRYFKNVYIDNPRP